MRPGPATRAAWFREHPVDSTAPAIGASADGNTLSGSMLRRILRIARSAVTAMASGLVSLSRNPEEAATPGQPVRAVRVPKPNQRFTLENHRIRWYHRSFWPWSQNISRCLLSTLRQLVADRNRKTALHCAHPVEDAGSLWTHKEN